MQPAEWLIQHQGMMINLVEFLEKKVPSLFIAVHGGRADSRVR